MNDTITTPTTVHQIGAWGTFEELSKSIKSRVFGHIVALAAPVVKEYHGDLFWDAQWIEKNLCGPTSFDVVVRTSGTHLGSIARQAFDSYAPGGILYTFDVYSEDNRVWNLRITEVARAS